MSPGIYTPEYIPVIHEQGNSIGGGWAIWNLWCVVEGRGNYI